eukprot:gene13332-14709_t
MQAYGPEMFGAEVPLMMPDCEMSEYQKKEEKKKIKIGEFEGAEYMDQETPGLPAETEILDETDPDGSMSTKTSVSDENLVKTCKKCKGDAILLGEAGNDTALRREIADALKSSNETFADALKTTSESTKSLSESMAASMQALTQSFSSTPPKQHLMGQNVQGTLTHMIPSMRNNVESPQYQDARGFYQRNPSSYASFVNLPPDYSQEENYPAGTF